jgi:Glycosyl transferase family 2
MGASALGEKAIWTADTPSFEKAQSSGLPIFLGPPVRHNVAPALAKLAAAPLQFANAARLGESARDLLSFAVWSVTAKTLGITEIIRPDGSVSPLDKCITTTNQSERASSPPSVGLAMMVQDEEKRLARCLSAVADWVSEIVVVDGGSKDATKDIAAEFGARIVARPFDGDYSAQRNAGLTQIRTPWVIVLDADEALAPGLSHILDHVASSGLVEGAYIHLLNTLDSDSEPWFWPDRKLRFFKSGHLMSGRIHEGVSGLKSIAWLPLTGPYILHNKSRSDQWDRERQYYEMDPSYYTSEDAARINRWRSVGGGRPETGVE